MFKRVCILVCCVALMGCGRQRAALPALEDAYDANLLMVHLHEAGITEATLDEPQRNDAAFIVRVPSSQIDAARQVMVQLGLPRTQRPGLDALLDDAGMIPTPTDEQARLMRARANEVASSLEVLDGVLRAHVHVNLTTQRPTLSNPMAPRPQQPASVAIVLEQHDGAQGVPDDEQVRGLVLTALGLGDEATQVTVLRQERTFQTLDAQAIAEAAPTDVTVQLLIAAIVLGTVAIMFMVLWVRERGRGR